MKTTGLFFTVCLAALLPLTGCEKGQFGTDPSGQVRVTTEPAGATITLDGVAHDMSPVTITEVAPGDHLLVVRKEGYKTTRRAITVRSGQKMALELPLEPIEGLVLIHSVPPGAEVEMNGAFKGNTPLLMTDTPLGTHRLVISKEGHTEKEVELVVEDRIPQKVEVSLSSDTATLVVRSEPAGAVVQVNGVSRGVTPCEVDEIPAGITMIKLSKEGYAPHQESINLRIGDRHEVQAVLEGLPATLEVVSIPEKARVYFNDQLRGTTPHTARNLEPGTYRVRVELPGYETDARTIPIEANETKTEEFRLLKNSGLLVLVTEPAGVKVFIDGRFQGETEPSTSDVVSKAMEIDLLTQGEHMLQLSKSGFIRSSKKILIQPNKIVSLHEKLTRRFIPDTMVWVGTGPEGVKTGRLVQKHPNGDVELEMRPGIFLTIPAEQIIQIKDLSY
jgi:hypothetical protein